MGGRERLRGVGLWWEHALEGEVGGRGIAVRGCVGGRGRGEGGCGGACVGLRGEGLQEGEGAAGPPPISGTVLRVVANSDHVHNLIVCTLCSCYPVSAPPLPSPACLTV